MSLFSNYCAYCGKRVADCYAINRQGDLPVDFCDNVCRTDYARKKQFKLTKPQVNTVWRKGLSSDEVTARMGNTPWKVKALNKECGIYQVVRED